MNLQNPQLLRSTNFIAGNWVAADSKATLTVVNPATGLPLAEVPRCGAVETLSLIHISEPTRPY